MISSCSLRFSCLVLRSSSLAEMVDGGISSVGFGFLLFFLSFLDVHLVEGLELLRPNGTRNLHLWILPSWGELVAQNQEIK